MAQAQPQLDEETRVTIRLDSEDSVLLEKLMAKHKLKASDIIRQALRDKAAKDGVKA